MEWIKGKKTIIGSVLAGLLTTLWGLDHLVNAADATWISDATYAMLAGPIAAWTGVSLRLAVGNGKP